MLMPAPTSGSSSEAVPHCPSALSGVQPRVFTCSWPSPTPCHQNGPFFSEAQDTLLIHSSHPGLPIPAPDVASNCFLTLRGLETLSGLPLLWLTLFCFLLSPYQPPSTLAFLPAAICSPRALTVRT